MMILSHRGYWKSADEKNTETAFSRSFDLGFGTETDVRDCAGELVISHDMPDGSEMTLDAFLDILDGRNLPLAINIKSDGLARTVSEVMTSRGVQDWFVFDMSVPDMRHHLAARTAVFTRLSDVEPTMAFFDESQGVWLDMFDGLWYDTNALQVLLGYGKRVCVVSSELHGRDHAALWTLLKPFSDRENLLLCTDLPEDAQAYFGVAAANAGLLKEETVHG